RHRDGVPGLRAELRGPSDSGPRGRARGAERADARPARAVPEQQHGRQRAARDEGRRSNQRARARQRRLARRDARVHEPAISGEVIGWRTTRATAIAASSRTTSMASSDWRASFNTRKCTAVTYTKRATTSHAAAVLPLR